VEKACQKCGNPTNCKSGICAVCRITEAIERKWGNTEARKGGSKDQTVQAVQSVQGRNKLRPYSRGLMNQTQNIKEKEAEMKKSTAPVLISWEQVDEALKRMGEIDIAISKIEGDMTLRINEIKAEAEAKVEAIRSERKALEKMVTAFAESKKDEFLKTRTKELTFGVISFRVTTKIIIRAKKACVAAMEALGLDGYLRIVKEPDKDLMLNLDDATLARIGASRKIEDRLKIEPNIEKVKDAA